MEAKDWQRVEDLFHVLRALGPPERATYLDRACEGEGWLRAEVESLLTAAESNGHFLEKPALSLGMKVLSTGLSEGPTEGESLGPYRILRLLGEGGMGKVYLAEDTRLGRKVALKFVARGLTDDAWARRQLIKEAQAAAMLEHPNICTVHGIEEAGGYSFIVMQYVEGETLSQLERKGPVTPEEAVRLATQIVGALASAHAVGVVHRDIKPQNTVVTTSGRVKVLDFGLAKIVRPPPADAPAGADGDAAAAHSFASGKLLVGTVAYMSPEQLRGEELDGRSDIFSFGTLFYELICGRNPFRRDSDAETISAILATNPPPLRRAAPGVSYQLSRVVGRCLEKSRELRYQSADELLEDMNRLRGGARLSFGLRRAVAVAVSVVILLVAALLFTNFRTQKFRALAVLPVTNEIADPAVDYLNDGLTEGLVGRLSRLLGLQVRPLTVVSSYRGKLVDPREAGRQLGVDAVLLSTVARQGDALVLRARLVNTSDGAELWGGDYNFSLTELPFVEKDVAEKIVGRLGGAAGAMPEGLRSRNPEALQNYLYGRHLLRKRDRENLRKAIDYLEKAVELDPAYAQAHAALAESYLLLPSPAYGSLTTKDVMYRARRAALSALEIDGGLCEAHTALGVFRLKYDWTWREAEADFRRAIELDPYSATAHYWYSNLLIVLGRFTEAIAESEKARDLDPYSPIIDMHFGRALYFARRYDQAAAHLKTMLEKDPNDVRASYVLGYIYQQTGAYDKALEIFEKFYAADKGLGAGPLGYTYARMGRKADALRLLGVLDELSGRQHVQAHERALIYIGLNDRDNAFRWLEESYRERFASVPYLTSEPIYDNLKSDARFAGLARRLNLTP